MRGCIGPTIRPMPIVPLHRTNDAVLTYSRSNDWSSVQSTLEHWINFNNTTTNPTLTFDNSEEMTVEHLVYNQGDSSVSVKHYKYIGGDHRWFNATYKGQSISELVWSVVSRYDIYGLL